MSHFYGTCQGHRGEATRCGTRDSGMITSCASWRGAVKCYAYEKDGNDWVRVSLMPWNGAGLSHVLYEGPISGLGPDGVQLAEDKEGG